MQRINNTMRTLKPKRAAYRFLNRRQVISLAAVTVLIASLVLTVPVRAAIAYHNFSTVENGGGSTTLSLTTPTGTLTNDVMIAVISVRGGTGVTITPPTDWTQKTSTDSTTSLKSATFVAQYSVVGSGPYTFTFSSSQKAAGVVVSYSGVDSVDAVGVTGSQANASGTTMTAPSITTLVPNAMLVGLYGNATGTTFTAGSSMTLRGQATSSGGGQAGTKVTTGVQDVVQAAAAATGTKTMAANNAAVSIGHLLSLRPLPTISQSSYRIFQYSGSTTVGAPYAAKDTVANLAKQVPFRLRLNLGVTSGGTNLSAVSGRTYSLEFAKLTAASCSVQTGYSTMSTSGNVKFYNVDTVADGASYVADATNDPTRAGVTAVGQKFVESNPLSMANAVPSGQDALWDISLITDAAVNYGDTYCMKINVNSINGTYSVYPQITIPVPTVSQANYRLFANADSLTPGTPLATQDTAATLATETPFRLRQRLAVDSNQANIGYANYKMQYAEKSGVCDTGFSGETYGDVTVSSSTSAQAFSTDARNTATIGTVAWSDPTYVYASDSFNASAFTLSSSGATTNYLDARGFGFSVPSNATIVGIYAAAVVSGSGGGGALVEDSSIRLIKSGTIVGSNLAGVGTDWTTVTARGWGGATELWGQSWTPTDINSTNFGVAIAANMYSSDGLTPTYANIDSVRLQVYYTVPTANTISYHANPTPAHNAATSSATGDPTNGARPTSYQNYLETDPFTNNASAIASGSDGLWDFALTSSTAAAGKSYCLRVVKSDGSLLSSYSNIPEIGFSAPAGPTLDQQLRGGAGVVNGTKSPLNW